MLFLLAQSDTQQLVVPVGLLIAILGPLYGLIGGLYVILFRHSNNEDKHINRRICDETREGLRSYIRDVDTRAEKGIGRLENNLSKKFDQLFGMLRK